MSKGLVLVTQQREYLRELFQRKTSDADLVRDHDASQTQSLVGQMPRAVTMKLDDQGKLDNQGTLDAQGPPLEAEAFVTRDMLHDRNAIVAESIDVEQHAHVSSDAETSAIPAEVRRPTLEACVDELERRVIEDSLRRNQQRRKETAAELGISRVTLYNKMKKLGLQ